MPPRSLVIRLLVLGSSLAIAAYLVLRETGSSTAEASKHALDAGEAEGGRPKPMTATTTSRADSEAKARVRTGVFEVFREDREDLPEEERRQFMGASKAPPAWAERETDSGGSIGSGGLGLPPVPDADAGTPSNPAGSEGLRQILERDQDARRRRFMGATKSPGIGMEFGTDGAGGLGLGGLGLREAAPSADAGAP